MPTSPSCPFPIVVAGRVVFRNHEELRDRHIPHQLPDDVGLDMRRVKREAVFSVEPEVQLS